MGHTRAILRFSHPVRVRRSQGLRSGLWGKCRFDVCEGGYLVVEMALGRADPMAAYSVTQCP